MERNPKTQNHALFIEPNKDKDESCKAVYPENGKYFTLTELQDLVGGRIERINCLDTGVVYVNENGRNLGLAENYVASEILELLPNSLVGNVLIIPNTLISK